MYMRLVIDKFNGINIRIYCWKKFNSKRGFDLANMEPRFFFPRSKIVKFQLHNKLDFELNFNGGL